METTEPVECDLVEVSPDFGYVACTSGSKVEIFSVCALELVTSFTCRNNVENVRWSPDSRHVVCSSKPQSSCNSSLLQLRNIASPGWRCSVRCDTSVTAVWSPDSCALLLISDLTLCCSVWLVDRREVFYIKYLKPVVQPAVFTGSCTAGSNSCCTSLSFTADGCRLAVLESRDCCDHISVFDSFSWTLISHAEFPVDYQLVAVSWSPENNVFCVHDDYSTFRLCLYDVHCCCLAVLKVDNCPLGAARVNWSPCGQLLAVTGYDHKVRLVSRQHWTVLVCFHHSTLLFGSPTLVSIYRQHYDLVSGYRLKLTLSAGGDPVSQVKYLLDRSRPILVNASATVHKSRVTGSTGAVSRTTPRAVFSPDGSFLVTCCELFAECVWIWNISHNLSLRSLLIMKSAVSDVCWSRDSEFVAVSTGMRHVCVWRQHRLCPISVSCAAGVDKLICCGNNTLILHGGKSLVLCKLTGDCDQTDIRQKQSELPVLAENS